MRRLEDGWRLACTPAGACATPAEAAGLTDWMAAPVPGTAAEALATAGRWRREAPTPLHDQDVWYRLELPEAGRRVLRFEGLATFAEVWVDGRRLAESSSMFAPLEVEAQIGPGAVLWLCFRALAPRLTAKGPRARWRPRMIEHQGLRLVRTSLLGHMPGWCPPIDLVGPFRPVLLIDPAAPRLLRSRILADWDGQGGRLSVEVELAGATTPPKLRCAGTEAPMTGLGEGRFAAELGPQVEPWFPHTHGPARLYDAELVLDDEVLPLGRVGFRRLAVDRGPDGKGFALRINGEPVFCRGANWITPDLVGLGGERAAYEPTLRLARDAGMNMVRVSGVGLYETRAFFELCDELGLMVWQDFMFANFDYPAADPAFAAKVEAEAESLLQMVQGSPSLAVLCGGSEVFQQATMMGLAPADLSWPLYDEVLSGLARELRPDVAYAPNTPSGGALPFVAGEGVAHYYGVGAYERPLEDARRAGVRFAAECLAFANVPQPESLARFAAPAVHDPRWKARTPRDRGASWDFEDVRDHYLQRVLGQDPHRLRREDPELYLDLSRVVTGEAMAATFAEWRRAASPCAGGLVWTLRDLELGAGWGLIDALGEPKPAWWILRRALQPVQVLLTDEGVDGLAVHLINETDAPVAAELRLAVFGEAPGAAIDVRRPVRLAPRSTTELSAFDLIGRFFDLTYAYRFGPRAHAAVTAQLLAGGEALSQALYLPPGVEAWRGGGEVAARLEADGADWVLTLTAERLQRWVHPAAAGWRCSDDWFPLLPGEPRRIRLSGGGGSPQGEIIAPGGLRLGAFGG